MFCNRPHISASTTPNRLTQLQPPIHPHLYHHVTRPQLRQLPPTFPRPRLHGRVRLLPDHRSDAHPRPAAAVRKLPGVGVAAGAGGGKGGGVWAGGGGELLREVGEPGGALEADWCDRGGGVRLEGAILAGAWGREAGSVLVDGSTLLHLPDLIPTTVSSSSLQTSKGKRKLYPRHTRNPRPIRCGPSSTPHPHCMPHHKSQSRSRPAQP